MLYKFKMIHWNFAQKILTKVRVLISIFLPESNLNFNKEINWKEKVKL